MKKFGRTKKIMGYDDGGEVSAQQALMAPKPKLSEDDFTQPGEMIPKDAGMGDFIKYNLAHRDPEQDAMQMGMGAAGIENVGKDLPADLSKLSPAAKQEMQDALDRLKGTIQSYGRLPEKPALSIPQEEALKNYFRKGSR